VRRVAAFPAPRGAARKEFEVTTFVVIVFPGDQQAPSGLQALRALDADGVVTLYGAAVVQRDRDGRIDVQEHEAGVPAGVGVRAVVGGLLRSLASGAGAVPPAACGTSFEAMHELFGTRVADGFLARVAKALAPFTTAIVAEISEEWRKPLDASVHELGGVVVRERRDDSADTQLQREFRIAQAESARLRADLSTAQGDLAEIVQVAIGRAEAKVKALRDVADARSRCLHEETATRLRVLLEQRAAARVDGKARIEQRLAEMRADDLRRSAALKPVHVAEAMSS